MNPTMPIPRPSHLAVWYDGLTAERRAEFDAFWASQTPAAQMRGVMRLEDAQAARGIARLVPITSAARLPGLIEQTQMLGTSHMRSIVIGLAAVAIARGALGLTWERSIAVGIAAALAAAFLWPAAPVVAAAVPLPTDLGLSARDAETVRLYGTIESGPMAAAAESRAGISLPLGF